MRICPQCGQRFSADYSYCLDDGSVLSVDSTDVPTQIVTPNWSPPSGMPTSTMGKSEPGKFVYIALGALGVLVIGLGFWAYSMYVSKEESRNKPATEQKVEQKNDQTQKVGTNAPATNAPAATTPPIQAVTSEQAEAVFERWLASQNAKDRAAYRSYYSTTMIGVKRVPGGGRREYKYNGWMADRLASMQKIVSVSEQNRRTTIEGESAVVRFTQFWRSVNYCDVGDKELRIKMFADGPKIVFETLENPRGC